MALAFFLLIQHTRSLDFETVFARAPGLASNHWLVNLVALGLLGGAVAKSAQLPLQTWLPDAMEGPTPVIALVQTDIKRVIAYSTMSQIGYMFLGAGLGAYANGMFHLMTHAFFKALLFMAAGIVIHALAGEQDMRKMGGLRHFLPRTYGAFLVGALALAGVPPFAGFFSKDSILAAALAHGWYGQILWVAGMIGAFLTGLYTFRMLFMSFWGEPSPFVREHFHALRRDVVGVSLAVPVGVLTLLAAFGGWLQFAGIWTPVSDWLEPVAPALVDASSLQEAASSVIAVALGIAGIGVAWWIYGARRAEAPKSLPLFERKFYFDELYDALVSYHVGLYGFSLWLVGLSVVVMAAAIGYAFWAGRDRPRAYYGLMLFLTGAIVGVFAAQDLLLFYVFWEAMLIPLYVLAACGLLYGSVLAFRAADLRGVIAYSSLAQLGLITLGLFAVNDLGLNGAVLQMINHGLISGTFFMLAGGIERRAATGEMARLGGMARGR